MRMKPYKIIAVDANSLFCNIENRRIFIMAFQIREFRKVTNNNFRSINIFSILSAVITERRRRKNAIRNKPKSNVNKRL